jgi:hypothetical protein
MCFGRSYLRRARMCSSALSRTLRYFIHILSKTSPIKYRGICRAINRLGSKTPHLLHSWRRSSFNLPTGVMKVVYCNIYFSFTPLAGYDSPQSSSRVFGEIYRILGTDAFDYSLDEGKFCNPHYFKNHRVLTII